MAVASVTCEKMKDGKWQVRVANIVMEIKTQLSAIRVVIKNSDETKESNAVYTWSRQVHHNTNTCNEGTKK